MTTENTGRRARLLRLCLPFSVGAALGLAVLAALWGRVVIVRVCLLALLGGALGLPVAGPLWGRDLVAEYRVWRGCRQPHSYNYCDLAAMGRRATLADVAWSDEEQQESELVESIEVTAQIACAQRFSQVHDEIWLYVLRKSSDGRYHVVTRLRKFAG
jgi:hypothetical protein